MQGCLREYLVLCGEHGIVYTPSSSLIYGVVGKNQFLRKISTVRILLEQVWTIFQSIVDRLLSLRESGFCVNAGAPARRQLSSVAWIKIRLNDPRSRATSVAAECHKGKRISRNTARFGMESTPLNIFTKPEPSPYVSVPVIISVSSVSRTKSAKL